MNKYLHLMRFLFILLTLQPGLAACQGIRAPAPPLTAVAVQLSWTHSSQFAGLYVADQQGYYAEEGLDVTWLEGGPTVDRLAALLAGEAQFAIASGPEIIRARAAGAPIRAIATIFRRSPFAFFSLADSGITRPEDFGGKVIQIRPRARPILYTMMEKVGMHPDQWREDPDAAFSALFTGQVDVATGFVTTELLAAEKAGYQLHVIYPDDYGVHFSTDSLVTTDAYLAANRETVVRFLRATLRGWRFAIENPTEAAQLTVHYNPAADPMYELNTLTASLPFIHTGQDPIGMMTIEEWTGMVDALGTYEFLDQTVPDPTDVFTLEILREIYPEQ